MAKANGDLYQCELWEMVAECFKKAAESHGSHENIIVRRKTEEN